MNILLIVNEQKDPECILAARVVDCIGNRATVLMEDTYQNIGLKSVLYRPADALYNDVDIILVLGGDGTMLSVAKEAAMRHIPIIGINLGRLGFLAEIEVNELEEGLNKLFAGEYVTEKRMMIEAKLDDNTSTTALNDIVIARANSLLKILELDVYIDGEYIDDFKADGIIISTPTGSTAYSLSAGGPIVDPTMESIIVTPICPHKMYCRTILVPPDKDIRITCKSSAKNDAVVAADSEILGKLMADTSVTIRVATISLELIRLKGDQFFGTLRKKLIEKES